MKIKLLLLLLLVVVLLPLIGTVAEAQTLLSTTNWTAGTIGSTSTGSAGSTTGWGNGWIDNYGGLANITSASPFYAQLKGTTSPLANVQMISRPSIENCINEEVVYYWTFANTGTYNIFALMSYQGSSTTYQVGQIANAATYPQETGIYKIVSGTSTPIGTHNVFSPVPSNGDILRDTCTRTVSGSTSTLTVTVYDVTTSTQIGTQTATDSTAGLQGAGQVAIMSISSTSNIVTLTQVQTYNDSSQAFTVSPTSVTNSGSETLTVTGNPTGVNQTSWTSGTTFSIAGISGALLNGVTSGAVPTTFNASTQVATFTLTNPTTTGELIVTDSTDTASNVIPVTTAPATAYTTTGPSSGNVSTASSNFTITPNGLYSGTITPSVSSGPTGTFTPSSLTFSSSSTPQTFTFTPTTTGTSVITSSGSPALTNTTGSLNYTVNAGTATAYTTTGPSSGNVSTASSNFTITPNGLYSGTITPSVSSGPTGTFTPSSLTFSSSSTPQTFTFTPTTTGTSVITSSGSPALTNTTGSLNYTVSSGPITIGISNSAWHFSPGIWAGDTGRGGSVYRRTWCNGAYAAVYWSSTSTGSNLTCSINITNATTGSYISYFINNNFVDDVAVPSSGSLTVSNSYLVTGANTLLIYTRNSAQSARWNETNSYTLTGVTVDGGSTAGTAPTWNGKWVLIYGDSVTEGINDDPSGNPDSLFDYAHEAGEALLAQGYDYGISACGYNGWNNPGDSTGDVIDFYKVTSGVYQGNSNSRWDQLDSTTSLLDSNNQISAYGSTNQTPSAIVINLIGNDVIYTTSVSDMQSAVTQCLTSLRAAAPNSWIFVFVQFNIYDTNISVYAGSAPYITALKAGFAAYQLANPQDSKVVLVDNGSNFAYQLGSITLSPHPIATGHALIAPRVSYAILSKLLNPPGRGRTQK